MAVSYITGIPGSGKSYLAVYKLWEAFIKVDKKAKKEEPKTPKYRRAYTNINQFKFDICGGNIKPFEFDIFMSDLIHLYQIYKSVDGKDDGLLIEEAKRLDLFEVLIVIDEAHNFLTDKENEIIKWWLTYHRHLGHEIWLITQDLSLISNGYKTIAEFFYKAVPSSRRLFKSRMRYNQYNSYKMYQKDYIDKFIVPALKEVFALYHSGSDGNSKSLIHKFIIMISLFVLILIGLFYFFMSQFSYDDQNTTKPKLSEPVRSPGASGRSNGAETIKQVKKHDLKGGYAVYITCINFQCNIIDNEYIYKPITYDYLSTLISENNFLYSERIKGLRGSFTNFYIFEENIFKNLIIKGVSNVKESVFDHNSSSNFSIW